MSNFYVFYHVFKKASNIVWMRERVNKDNSVHFTSIRSHLKQWLRSNNNTTTTIFPQTCCPQKCWLSNKEAEQTSSVSRLFFISCKYLFQNPCLTNSHWQNHFDATFTAADNCKHCCNFSF